MTDSSPARLESLVRRALELPVHAQDAFVFAECGGDAELARRVWERIEAARRPETPSATLVGGPDESLLAAHRAVDPADMVGQRIGPYHLLRVLGEGGFGTVFLAEQSVPVARQVAFKMLKPGMDSRQIVARFEQERQALALMDHPNIAKVFDAGTTERGLPFFVMELCRGEPLVSWCDHNRWDLEQRLALFVQVCQAVQHAHGKGIIHRDLKPSNVLVGAQDGVATPKVIDFGIAKAMSHHLTDKTFVTEAEQVIGTLKYMSPEQAEGSLDIDTRADVYSLGAVLYELLTGTTPFDDPTQEHPSQLELHRRIREQDPPRPSTRISQLGQGITVLAERRRIDPSRLPARVRGELDWIVMKAIERDRTRRYATALELAQDVQRFLDGEPVLAAPPSTAYILSKFVRRNRTAVLGAAAVALALVGGAIAFAWQASVARDERDAAVKARERAEQVASVMESVFQGINPDTEMETGLTLQDQLRLRLESMVGELARNEGDPLTRARLQSAFASALLGLTDFEPARRLLLEAEATRRELLGPADPLSIQAAEALGAAELRMGNYSGCIAILERLRDEVGIPDSDLLLGMAYRSSGRFEEAIAALERRRARMERDREPDTESGLLALHALGACYREVGRFEDAIALLGDVRQRREALLGPDHPDSMTTSNSLAVALSAAQRGEESLALYQGARQRMLARYQPDHEAILMIDANIATQLGALGRIPEAIERLEPTRARALARFPPDHRDNLRMGIQLARLYYESGRVEDSLRLLREVEPNLRPERDRGQGFESDCHMGIARSLAALRRYPETVAEYARVIELRRAERDEDDPMTLKLLVEYAGWQRTVGANDAAVALAEEVIRLKKSSGAAEDGVLAGAWSEIGAARFAQQRWKDAVAAVEHALGIRERVQGPDHEDTISVRSTLAAALFSDGQIDRSLPLARRALDDAQRVLGREAPQTVAIAIDLALNYNQSRKEDELFGLLREWLPAMLRRRGNGESFLIAASRGYLTRCLREGRHSEAVESAELHLALVREKLGPDHSDAFEAMNMVGVCCFRLKRHERAVEVFREMAERTRRAFGTGDPRWRMACANLAINVRDSGQPREALQLYEEVIASLATGQQSSSTDREFFQREFARTLALCDQRVRCVEVLAEMIVALRADSGARARLDSSLALAGTVLLDVGLPANAEPLLRECIEMRERTQPTAWNTGYARILLGDCLHGLARDAEARDLLERGGTELRAAAASVPLNSRSRLTESADRLLRFFSDIGDEAAAAPWREWREELARTMP